MKNYFPLTSLLVSSAIALAGDAPAFSPHPHTIQDAEHCNHNHNTLPIGLMGAHTHKKGEWMFSYRYMSMQMNDNYDGSSTVSTTEVLNNYLVTPTEMNMEMHMVGLMHGLTDRLTVSAMLNYVDLEMSHTTRMGTSFSTESDGLGDAVISGFYQFYNTDKVIMHAGLGLVLPTAVTDAEDFLPPMGRVGVLPYPMQLGSGSWGLRPSLTYAGNKGPLSWGAQVMANINLDDNDSGYRLGNSLTGNLWSAYSVADDLSISLRLQGSGWKNIKGSADNAATPVTDMMGRRTVPTADPNLRGGQRLDLFLGASYLIPSTNVRIAGEAGHSLWQDLDGPQLGTDLTVNLGLQFTF